MRLNTSFKVRSHGWFAAVALGLVLSVAWSAQALPVDWTNAVGANASFGWSGGQSGDGDLGGGGLWGDPVVSEPKFTFNAMDPTFRAEATGPASDNMLSSMSVVLNVFNASPPGAASITEVHIREFGTFTGDVADVSATSGTVLLVSAVPFAPPVNLGQLTMTFDIPAGTWEASMDIVLADVGGGFPAAVSVLSVDVTNHLKSIPGGGRTASIQKIGAAVTVPEPTTAILVLCGLVSMVARRARHGSRRA